MAGKSIAEIKKEYDLIKSMGVMEFKEQIAAIDKFALSYMADERSAKNPGPSENLTSIFVG